jgi:hypothetical protein
MLTPGVPVMATLPAIIVVPCAAVGTGFETVLMTLTS